MAEKTELFKQEDERAVLAVLLQDSNFIVNLDKWDLKPATFYFPEHRAIYSAILSLYNEKGSVDVYTLSSRLKAIGITKYNSLDMNEYLEGISVMPINKNLYSNYLEDVCRWYWLRQTYEKLKEGWIEIRNSRERPLAELQSMVEKIAVDATTTSVSNHDDEFVDFYGTAEEVIKGIADKGEPTGVYGPWESWNAHFGPMTFGDLYIFAARSKVGKSTILAFLANFFVRKYSNLRVLFFDTELESMRVQTRNLSSETGVNEFYYRHGGFKENKEMVSKAEKVFEEWRDLKGRFYHIYGADKPIDEVESIIKRFHSRHIKNDEILVVVYDYLKQTNDADPNQPEWLTMGNKGNTLKKLASALPKTIVLSAVQLNQEDNISQSARLGWISSYVGRLKRKTPEELAEHTDQFGTHYLETIFTRSLGENYDEYVTLKAGTETKYLPNNINLKFDNFSIEDMGSFKSMVKKLESQNRQLTLRDGDKKKRDYSKF